jgi:hypothetical protein
MKDPDDTKFKAEIDEIMRNVKNIISNIKNLDAVKSKALKQNEDNEDLL